MSDLHQQLATARTPQIHGGFAPPHPRIEQETPIVPRAVAEAVCEEARVWLQRPLPRSWVRELVGRANTVYRHNPRFRRGIRAAGNRGRDYLWMFMRHWVAAMLKERRFDLFVHLPASYAGGDDLPQRTNARFATKSSGSRSKCRE